MGDNMIQSLYYRPTKILLKLCNSLCPWIVLHYSILRRIALCSTNIQTQVTRPACPKKRCDTAYTTMILNWDWLAKSCNLSFMNTPSMKKPIRDMRCYILIVHFRSCLQMTFQDENSKSVSKNQIHYVEASLGKEITAYVRSLWGQTAIWVTLLGNVINYPPTTAYVEVFRRSLVNSFIHSTVATCNHSTCQRCMNIYRRNQGVSKIYFGVTLLEKKYFCRMMKKLKCQTKAWKSRNNWNIFPGNKYTFSITSIKFKFNIIYIYFLKPPCWNTKNCVVHICLVTNKPFQNLFFF